MTQAEVRDLAARGDLSFLDPEVLQQWVVDQRWFGSKSRQLSALEVLQGVPLRDDEPLLVLALVAARFPSGTHDLYQLPLGIRHADEGWDKGVVAEVDNWTVYDALTDPVHAQELLKRMRDSSVARAGGSTLTFRWAGSTADLNGPTDVRPMGVEQSNSSMVFGDALVLKSFRRLEPGVNPELELLRFLDQHGFQNIAPLAGWYEYEGRLVESTLGILQQYLKGARDGWALAVEPDGEDPDRLIEQLVDLGAVTGRMHSVLGSDASDSAFAPEEPTDGSLALITATVDEDIERIFKNLPSDDPAVAAICDRGQDVRERLGQLSRIGVGGRIIRTHGDYHLGQVMLTDRGWVILDFEGEPARTLPERRQKRSPLRDVAGMLRSFSYVAAAGDILGTREMPEDWELRARAAFLEGYFSEVDPALLPPGQESTDKLLAIFELEKAVYELNYEINNRPDWVGIPVRSILRLLEAE